MANLEGDPAVGYAMDPKFAGFVGVVHIEYNKIRNTPIHYSVLVPPTAPAANAPVIVRFHGGYLSYSSRLHAEWFPKWLLDYAIQQGAVIVAPDYRLLPEATGRDQVADLLQFWFKLSSTMAEHPDIPHVNTRNTLVVGDSAGSHLAAISALKFNGGVHQPDIEIKAVISGFGMLSMSHPFFSSGEGQPAPKNPPQEKSVFDRHMQAVAQLPERPVVTYAQTPERLALSHAIHQHRLYKDLLGGDRNCFTRNILTSITENDIIPRFWIYHGRHDQIVPFAVSEEFVNHLGLVIAMQQRGSCEFTKLDGDHGLDRDWDLKTPELVEGLSYINEVWGRNF